MINMVKSLYIIIIGLGILFVSGFPLADYLISKCNFKSEKRVIMLTSFILGFSIIAIVIGNLVNVGVPIYLTGKYFIILSIFLFIVYLFTYRKNDGKVYYLFEIIKESKWLLLCLSIVVLVNSVSYMIKGPYNYLGYRFADSYYYVTQTEMNILYGTNLPTNIVNNSPWLIYANNLSDMRVGRSAVQGLIAIATNFPSEGIIGFIGLLSPFFVYGNIYTFLSQFRKIKNKLLIYIIPLFCSLVPGFVSLQLENYYGASMSVPFIIGSILFYGKFLSKSNNKALLILSIILAASGITVFAESFICIIPICAIMYFYHLLKSGGKSNLEKFSFVIFLLCIVLLDFTYIRGMIDEITYLIEGNRDMMAGYTELKYGKGFIDIYIGGGKSNVLILIGEVISYCSIIGLAYKFISTKSEILLGLIIFMLSNLAAMRYDYDNVYTIFRLILMSSCLAPLGVYYFIEAIYENNVFGNVREMFEKILLLIYVFIFTITSMFSFYNCSIIFLNESSEKITFKENMYLNNHYNILKNMKKNLYFVGAGDFISYWSFYYGKNNKFWLNHNSVSLPYAEINTFNLNNYNNMPDDVQVFYDLLAYNPVSNQDEKINYGVHLENIKTKRLVHPSRNLETVGSAFDLQIFSKCNSLAKVKITSKENGGIMKVEDKIVEMNNNTYIFDLNLVKGINHFTLLTNNNIEISDYTFEILK